jgi:hypothetical protein
MSLHIPDPEDNNAVLRAQHEELKLLERISAYLIRIKVIEGKCQKGEDFDLYGWKPFQTVWPKVERPIYTRGILPNEILIDPDISDWNVMTAGIEKLALYCRQNSIPLLMGYSGGKGIHVSIFYRYFDTDTSLSEELLKLDIDTSKIIRRALVIALAEKAGVDLESIRLDWGKINFNRESKGSQVRTFGTMRAPGCIRP